MTTRQEIHLGDIGTVITGVFRNAAGPVDVSGALAKQIILSKPGGTERLVKTAEFTTDGTDGSVQYTAVEGDLDTVGVWKIQGFVRTPSGEWWSQIQTFRVYPNL